MGPGNSSRELLEVIEMPDTAKSRSGGSLSQRAAWKVIAKAYAVDYAVLVALALVTIWCETAAPFAKVTPPPPFFTNSWGAHCWA